jgi:hypothetical protein
MNAVVQWIFMLMTLVAPPDRLASRPQWPGWVETAAEKEERYAAIAQALYEVEYDPSEKPLYGGPMGRAMTAATVLAVLYHESGFARDVDQGPCYQGKGAPMRCDGGRSACMAQIQIGEGTTTLRSHGIAGLTKADLFADRKLCFKVAQHLIRRSFVACAKQGPNAKLNAYASGVCTLGQDRSIEILSIARRFVADRSSIPGPDAEHLWTQPIVEKDPNPLSLLDPALRSE